MGESEKVPCERCGRPTWVGLCTDCMLDDIVADRRRRERSWWAWWRKVWAWAKRPEGGRSEG